MGVKMDNIKESREERFKRIAAFRTQKILDYIRLLGNCSNKSSYSYNDIDVNKIFFTIERELKNTKDIFKSNNIKKKAFTL